VLRQRLLTAAVGIPLLVAVLVLGEPLFSPVVIAAAAIGAWELWQMARRRGYAPSLALMAALAVLYVLDADLENRYLALLLALTVALPLAWSVTRVGAPTALADWTLTLAAPLYTGWLLAHFVLLRHLPNGLAWVAVAIFGVFASDTAAYFTGRALGRHPLAPRVSPKKTVEGALGGLGGSLVAVPLLVALLGLPLALPLAALLGLLISLAGQLGDLVESGLKRMLDAKDSSRLLPGHGGLLDRADSLNFAVPLVFYALVALGLA
jgi:phosphatidate cytidylyltransferase